MFTERESRVLHLAPHHDLHGAAAHINLAFGAWGCGDLRLAKAYVKAGLTIARRRKDRHVVEVGTSLANDLRRRKPPPSQAAELDAESAAQLAELSEIVTTQLHSWHGDTWTKKENQAGPLTLGAV